MKDNLLPNPFPTEQPDSQNVTDLEEAKTKLRQSEEYSNLLIESATDYAIFRITPDGLIALWNIGAERIFGYTKSEIIGQKVDVLFTPEDRAKGIPQKELKTALKEGCANDDRWQIRKDETRFFASSVVTLLKVPEEGFVKITRNQTSKIVAGKVQRDKEILQKLVKAQEDERKRITRDLHDELGQELTALRMKLEQLKKLCENDKNLSAKVDDVQTIAKRIDDGVDFLAWELRPAVLDDLGLTAALEKYVAEWSQHSGVTAELITPSKKVMRFSPEAETNLYRIVQEALNNIHKHAKAKKAGVLLDKRDGSIVLNVEDDGIGFNPKSKKNLNKGIGLLGRQERVAIIGGNVEIESASKKGTTIYVRVPIVEMKAKLNK